MKKLNLSLLTYSIFFILTLFMLTQINNNLTSNNKELKSIRKNTESTVCVPSGNLLICNNLSYKDLRKLSKKI